MKDSIQQVTSIHHLEQRWTWRPSSTWSSVWRRHRRRCAWSWCLQTLSTRSLWALACASSLHLVPSVASCMYHLDRDCVCSHYWPLCVNRCLFFLNCFVFAGWLSIDQTLLGNAMGYRAAFLTSNSDTLRQMDSMRSKQSSVLKWMCMFIERGVCEYVNVQVILLNIINMCLPGVWPASWISSHLIESSGSWSWSGSSTCITQGVAAVTWWFANEWAWSLSFEVVTI